MPKKIIIIGPAHPLRGGLAAFNHRLCVQLQKDGFDCKIFSFSIQYPSLLFPGKTQYSTEPAPEGIRIYSVINSIHPANWWQIGNQLKNIRPDIILVRYWLPFMGPALGTILRRVQKNTYTKIIALADNIIPHEKRFGDIAFTRYFLNSCDAVITMSNQVMDELRQFDKEKPARLAAHPLIDNFGDPLPKDDARKQLHIATTSRVVLFFGFIRKYKGLDLLLQAFKIVKEKNKSYTANCKLLVAGEFYDDEKKYQELIDQLGIREQLILKTDFIPDSEVKYYFCAADVVVQPYKSATQSGITPLAYFFEKPMIVTNVGGLPDVVPNRKTGLVCEPDAASIADAIDQYFQLGEEHFLPHLRSEKEKYSWTHLIKAILELADQVHKK